MPFETLSCVTEGVKVWAGWLSAAAADESGLQDLPWRWQRVLCLAIAEHGWTTGRTWLLWPWNSYGTVEQKVSQLSPTSLDSSCPDQNLYENQKH